MRKTIEINGIQCRFKSSAAIPRMYRLKFNRDIFVDLNNLKKQIEKHDKIEEELKRQAEENGEEFDREKYGSTIPINSLEMFENIAFLMHKHGDPEQASDINEWLEQFETFDIYKILPEILEMWNMENKTTSIQKKEAGK